MAIAVAKFPSNRRFRFKGSLTASTGGVAATGYCCAFLSDLASSREKFSVLDVGASSGDMGQCIREALPNAKVFLTDYRLAHLCSAALTELAADAFSLPFHPGTFDFVVCSSMLHHFPDNEVVDFDSTNPILARRALTILDLERHPIPYYFLPVTRRVFGWSTLTLHDGPISVAGFRSEELPSLTTQPAQAP